MKRTSWRDFKNRNVRRKPIRMRKHLPRYKLDVVASKAKPIGQRNLHALQSSMTKSA